MRGGGPPFCKLGVQLVIDGIEGSLLQGLLETESTVWKERHKTNISILKQLVVISNTDNRYYLNGDRTC